MPNMTKPMRFLLIVKVLEQTEKPTLAGLRRLFKCSKRTIYRDLELLKELGVPIILQNGRYAIIKSAWKKVSARSLLRRSIRVSGNS